MSPEKCADCQRIFKEIKESYPDWPVRDRFQLAYETLRNIRREGECRLKRCLPLEQTERTIRVLDDAEKQPPKVEPEWMKKAREIVELHILDEVHGHPDKWTAYSAAKGCGCSNCRRNLEEWKTLYGK